jgi:hypothetical protein
LSFLRIMTPNSQLSSHVNPIPPPHKLTTRVIPLPDIETASDRRRFISEFFVPDWPDAQTLGGKKWAKRKGDPAFLNPRRAMEVFLRFDSLASGLRGSQRIFHRSALTEIRWIQRDFEECLSFVRHGGLAHHCPSPWHALLLLTKIQQQCFRAGFALVMRGQADREWKLQSSVERLSLPRATHAGMTLKVFSGTLRTASKGVSHFSPTILDALAQHYGIPTRFLDFTSDPAVAVWFATRSAQKSGPKAGAVYAIQTPNALELGAHFVLPPPFARRLYIQEGLFIDTRRVDAESLASACFKFTFDQVSEPHYRAWRLGQPLRMYPFNHWIDQSVRLAGDMASELDSSRVTRYDISQVTHKLLGKVGLPPFLTPDRISRQNEEWLRECYETLHRLCFAIHSIDEPNVLRLDALRAFVRSNRAVCRLLLPELEAHASRVRDPVDEKLATLIRSLS